MVKIVRLEEQIKDIKEIVNTQGSALAEQVNNLKDKLAAANVLTPELEAEFQEVGATISGLISTVQDSKTK